MKCDLWKRFMLTKDHRPFRSFIATKKNKFLS